MKLRREGDSLPVYFMIQKNVNESDHHALEPDDLTFTFDIKGAMHKRKILKNPRDILEFEIAAKEKHKYQTTLKDQDFLQSFKKLDLNRNQSENILN